MSKFQIATKPGHRASEHLFVIFSLIAKCEREKQATLITLFDLKKYFDRESTVDCFYEVYKNEIKGKVYRMLYLLNKNVRIQVRTPVGVSQSVEENNEERMLGVSWYAKEDVFKFKVRINLSPLKKKVRLGPDLGRNDLVQNPPKVITRRQYYSQIQSLYDPIGLLSPFLLKSKIILQKTWNDGNRKLVGTKLCLKD